MTTAQRTLVAVIATVAVVAGGVLGVRFPTPVFGGVNAYEAGVKWFGNGIYAGLSQQFGIDNAGNVTSTASLTVSTTTITGLLTRSPAVVSTTTTGGNSRTLSQADL